MDDPAMRKTPLTEEELDKVLPLLCGHCGQKIKGFNSGTRGHWAHVIGDSFLNRCQRPDVRYGMEAHPRGISCPDWCLGSRES